MPERMYAINAVIFDWGGTIVDNGCMAPVEAIGSIFSSQGITVSDKVIRESMGLLKRDHLQSLLARSEIQVKWQQLKGTAWTEEDLNKLNEALEAVLPDMAKENSRPVPGAVQVLERLRKEGIRRLFRLDFLPLLSF